MVCVYNNRLYMTVDWWYVVLKFVREGPQTKELGVGSWRGQVVGPALTEALLAGMTTSMRSAT